MRLRSRDVGCVELRDVGLRDVGSRDVGLRRSGDEKYGIGE